MLPPSSATECLDLIRAAERYYNRLTLRLREDDRYYEGEIDRLVRLPEGFEITIPSTARDIIDTAVDNITPDEIKFNYAPRGISQRAEDDADLVRSYLVSLWDNWRGTSNDIDVVRDFAKNLYRSGKACFKLSIDWSLWPVLTSKTEEYLRETGGGSAVTERAKQIETLRRSCNPLVLRSLPPQCIMEDQTVGGRKLWVIEKYRSDISEIRNLYAQFDPSLRDLSISYTSHTIHEVWTASYTDWDGTVHPGHFYIFVDYDLKHEDTNPYGFLPYTIRYSGYGRESYEGKPEYKSVGLYTTQVKSLILAEVRRASQFDAIMSMLAFPIGLVPESLDLESFDVTPGAMNPVPDQVLENAHNIWLKAPIPDAEYLTSLNWISGQIERGTIQRSLGGARVPGVASASQLGQYTDQSRLRLEACEEATEGAVADISSKALYFIDETLKQDVGIFVAEAKTPKYTLGPKNIKGRYEVTCEFMPHEEALKERRLALTNDAIVKGGLSPYDALEFAGWPNPRELIARRFAYDIMQIDEVKKAIGKEYLQQWGLDADALAFEEQANQGQMQVLLQRLLAELQAGTFRGVGYPESPNGVPPPNNQMSGVNPAMPPGQGGQQGLPALAQAGRGPMPMRPGRPALPPFQPAPTLQRPPGQ